MSKSIPMAPGYATPDRSARRALVVLSAGAVVLLLALIATADLAGMLAHLPACPFRTITGIPCPGCGGTRALTSIARGDFAGAMAMNTAVALAALVTIHLGVMALAWPAMADRVLDRLHTIMRTRWARWGAVLIVIAEMFARAQANRP